MKSDFTMAGERLSWLGLETVMARVETETVLAGVERDGGSLHSSVPGDPAVQGGLWRCAHEDHPGRGGAGLLRHRLPGQSGGHDGR